MAVIEKEKKSKFRFKNILKKQQELNTNKNKKDISIIIERKQDRKEKNVRGS